MLQVDAYNEVGAYIRSKIRKTAQKFSVIQANGPAFPGQESKIPKIALEAMGSLF